MSKRFTDSKKWDDPWFIDLSNEHKLLWIFILDKCDHAGIYKHSERLTRFMFGDVKFGDFIKVCNGRLVSLKPYTYYVPKFNEFQYGELNPDNRVHKSVIDILEKEGAYKGLISSMEGCKDKDKDKEKVKDKEKDNIKKFDFESFWNKYPVKVGKKMAEKHFDSSVKTQQDFDDLNRALANYMKSKRVSNGFVQNGSTFMNNWRDWVNYKEETCSKCKDKGSFMSATGYSIICDCPAGKRK